jgi:hypothetical protein
MSLSTDTFDNLKLHTEAMCGNNFNSHEAIFFQRNVNLAASRAYGASSWWERFLVVSEPRTVTRGDVDFTEDSFQVYGAGSVDVNGLYVRNGTNDGKPKYTLYESDGTTAKRNIIFVTADTQWKFSGSNNDPEYTIDSSADLPPTSGWDVDSGVSPAPLLVDVSEIGTVLQVNRYDLTTDGNPYCPIKYHVTARGITLHDQDVDTVYVTYKKPLNDKYGDGTGGTVSTIPSEWFDYIALYSARLYQIANRQSNPNPMATIASREVDEALQDAKMKLEEQNISNSVAKRIQTHLQYNTQL